MTGLRIRALALPLLLAALCACPRISSAHHEAWPYTLRDENGHATLSTSRFVIVFEGESLPGTMTGNLRVVGRSTSRSKSSAGAVTFEAAYEDDENRFTFAGRTFVIQDAEVLVYDGQEVVLDEYLCPRVVIQSDGTLRLD